MVSGFTVFLLVMISAHVAHPTEVDEELVVKVVEEAEAEVDRITLENTISGYQSHLVPGHSRRGVTRSSRAMERRNDVIRIATKKLAKILDVSDMEAAHRLRELRQSTGFLSDLCIKTNTPCSITERFSKFRTINGRCNNVQAPLWGATDIPFRRILSPCKREFFKTRNTLLSVSGRNEDEPLVENDEEENKIEDLSNSFRQSCLPVPFMERGVCPLGNQLPNPRLVSQTFHKDQNVPSPKLTQLFTIFAQFVDHDLTLTTTYTVPDCCKNASDTEKCAPVTVSNDPFYTNGKCLNFARSLIFCEELGCDTDPMNTLTAYVDASQVYGSDVGNSTQLRSLTGGKLLTSGVSLFPIIGGAFKAGETRALENPALGSVQTIFLREHNRVAQLIQTRFPSWSDAKIFNHARRIVIGEYQNIVFGEMLPLILGTDTLFPAGTVATPYLPNIDASMINEFSTAAFRFGHTLLNGKFDRYDPVSGSALESYLLRFNFDNDTLYKQDPDKGMTSILRGLTAQPAQVFDQFLTQEVTNFLFSKQTDKFLFGEDLVTRNIQRGRDHSIQPWLSYRQWCGLFTPDDWNIRPQDISADKWSTLRSLYLRVADIDLFTGGLAEVPVQGGTVGKTFACIIKHQFMRLIDGDRFFFTHTSNVGTQFNLNQINALRNVKMSDIICKTSKISQVQRRAFEIPTASGGNNPLVPCTNAYNLDVAAFLANCNCQNIGTQIVDCDMRCLNPSLDPFQGLGCNAGGQGITCRFCGFNNYPPC